MVSPWSWWGTSRWTTSRLWRTGPKATWPKRWRSRSSTPSGTFWSRARSLPRPVRSPRGRRYRAQPRPHRYRRLAHLPGSDGGWTRCGTRAGRRPVRRLPAGLPPRGPGKRRPWRRTTSRKSRKHRLAQPFPPGWMSGSDRGTCFTYPLAGSTTSRPRVATTMVTWHSTTGHTLHLRTGPLSSLTMTRTGRTGCVRFPPPRLTARRPLGKDRGVVSDPCPSRSTHCSKLSHTFYFTNS
mmetsp:Transcript_14523/g.41250  ORF Transcript_14523/g.41250 Transcript_14523/m.41250 type:complete len:238 (-) Transcript_14523:371-1084(-)